jgi:hypothetical protein
MFIANDGDNKVYVASIPSGISQKPKGITHDGTNFYILVNGNKTDHIIVTDASGTVVNDYSAPSRNSEGLTYMDETQAPAVGDATNGTTTLYVAYYEDRGNGRSRYVARLNPETGEFDNPNTSSLEGNRGTRLETDRNVVGWVEKFQGIANDGENLLIQAGNDSLALQIAPEDGSWNEQLWYVESSDGPYVSIGGATGIAIHPASKDIVVVDSGEITRLSPDGVYLGQWATSGAGNSLEGIVVVGDVGFMADKDGKKIHKAVIPGPEVTVSSEPKAMATDGTKLYVVTEGRPKDRILVLDTSGNLINTFDAPGNNTNGLTYHEGYLYALLNETHPNFGVMPVTITKISSTTGEVLDDWVIRTTSGAQARDTVSGLSVDPDNSKFIITRRDSMDWWEVDIADPGAGSTAGSPYSSSGTLQQLNVIGTTVVSEAPLIDDTLVVVGKQNNGDSTKIQIPLRFRRYKWYDI